MAVSQAHQLGHLGPVIGAGVARQVQVFKELVSDAHPTCIQGRPEPPIGQFENWHVGFEGVKDQDVPSRQGVGRLDLRAARARLTRIQNAK
jgi:hypothetical protein